MKLTVGDLRQLISGLPDATLIFPDWDEPPDDSITPIDLVDFQIRNESEFGGRRAPYLSVVIRPTLEDDAAL